jgi:hypothetical protein
VNPPGPLSISYGHVGCLKARAFPPPRVNPPAPLSLSLSLSHSLCLVRSISAQTAAGEAAAPRSPLLEAAAAVAVGPRPWISRDPLKSLLNFKERIEIPVEF